MTSRERRTFFERLYAMREAYANLDAFDRSGATTIAEAIAAAELELERISAEAANQAAADATAETPTTPSDGRRSPASLGLGEFQPRRARGRPRKRRSCCVPPPHDDECQDRESQDHRWAARRRRTAWRSGMARASRDPDPGRAASRILEMRVEPTRFHSPWTTIAAQGSPQAPVTGEAVLDKPRADAGPGDGRRDDVHTQAEQSQPDRDDGSRRPVFVLPATLSWT